MGIQQFLQGRTWALCFTYFICFLMAGNYLILIYFVVTFNWKAFLIFAVIALVQRPLLFRWPAFINFIHRIYNQTKVFRSFKRIYESELQDESTMFTYFPHSIYAMMILTNMNYGNDPLSKATGLGSRPMFYLPILSCLISWWGLDSVNQSRMTEFMEKNANIALYPGGFEEQALTTNKACRVFIKKRKGFIKMALRYGYKVAPVLCLGENNTLNTIDHLLSLRLFLASIKIPAILPYSRFGVFPNFDVDITVIVGKPIQVPKIDHPTTQDVKHWHKVYMEQIVSLYEKYKDLNNNLPLEIH